MFMLETTSRATQAKAPNQSEEIGNFSKKLDQQTLYFGYHRCHRGGNSLRDLKWSRGDWIMKLLVYGWSDVVAVGRVLHLLQLFLAQHVGQSRLDLLHARYLQTNAYAYTQHIVHIDDRMRATLSQGKRKISCIKLTPLPLKIEQYTIYDPSRNI